MVGLQNHLSLFTRASCAARDLGIELSEAFCRAEIGGKQRTIDIQQRHQGNIREMMTFGQHLSADQDACAAAMNIGEVLFERAFTAGGIPVDARDRHAGKQRRQRLLQLFGAQSDRHQMRRAAGGALARDRTLAVAVVAA